MPTALQGCPSCLLSGHCVTKGHGGAGCDLVALGAVFHFVTVPAVTPVTG
jgi:hypothetical protein